MRERRDIRRDAQLSRFLVAHVLSQSGMSARWVAHAPDYPARVRLHRIASKAAPARAAADSRADNMSFQKLKKRVMRDGESSGKTRSGN